MGVDEVLRAHAALAGQLQLSDAQQPLAGGHVYALAPDGHHGTRLGAFAVHRVCLPHPQVGVLVARLRHRPGIEGAHLAFDLGGRSLPVYPGLGLLQLVRIHRLCVVLRLRGQRALRDARQGLHQGLRAQRGKAVVQAAAGLVRRDGEAFDQVYRPGIQALLHLHDGHTGLGVARLDRALDRRRPAPARQDGGMDVDAAQARRLQHRLRQQQAVGHHHHQVGPIGGQALHIRRVLEIHRLLHRDGRLQRDLLDRAGCQLAPAPGRAVRLGVHRDHLVGRVDQGPQRGYGKVRRTGEDDAQRAGHDNWEPGRNIETGSCLSSLEWVI